MPTVSIDFWFLTDESDRLQTRVWYRWREDKKGHWYRKRYVGLDYTDGETRSPFVQRWSNYRAALTARRRKKQSLQKLVIELHGWLSQQLHIEFWIRGESIYSKRNIITESNHQLFMSSGIIRNDDKNYPTAITQTREELFRCWHMWITDIKEMAQRACFHLGPTREWKDEVDRTLHQRRTTDRSIETEVPTDSSMLPY